ncbi:Adenine deaminase [Alteribacillus persepolensis]|uniref:Adenine deaminase n=1 Tax=Alteribacillus persepolensis TaxID=568899 RepID=A0A1G8FTB4_9BACI|nr:adenine deaminase [Alteribacillus persepolensis]SDH85341.1 Adenine deaminase [Alteribacillus persepolensis]
MPTQKEILKKRIDVASGRVQADVVIKNARIIDVFNHDIIEGEDVAIADGYIAGIGKYDGTKRIDANNRYLCPSFIDGHVHIESSMVAPSVFAQTVLPHGVTTIITDPHEIANVAGTSGIQFMLDDAKNTPLDIRLMLPSCVPATPFEHNGAALHAEDLEPFFNNPQVHGLAEVMDYPSVLHTEESMMNKLTMAQANSDYIDGHAAGLSYDALNVYGSAGIKTDHECSTVHEARERLRLGMYVMMREGSAAKDLTSILPLVNDHNARRFLFCTDDKHLDDLQENGSIDHHVRLSIEHGLSPLTAVQMASLNAAECYGLKTKGAIAPGYEADFLLLDNLEQVSIRAVYISGELQAENGTYAGKPLAAVTPPSSLTQTVHVPALTEQDLSIPLSGERAHIIEVNPNRLITNKVTETVTVQNQTFSPSIERDQLKIAVLERHTGTGNIGLGIVKGFGIQHGAIASTIAHDSHNVVTAGTNDYDMITAVRVLGGMQGGLAVVQGGKTLAALPLPLAGLMSSETDSAVVGKHLREVNDALTVIGCSNAFDPILTLSFLTLPVIPALKLTDTGLFDVSSFSHISIDPLKINE